MTSSFVLVEMGEFEYLIHPGIWVIEACASLTRVNLFDDMPSVRG
jgi:hypothetical protein